MNANCPECGVRLEVIDSMAPMMAPIITQFIVSSWLELILLFVAIGCGFAYASYDSPISIIIGVVAIVIAVRLHKPQSDKYMVYECSACKKRFIGNELKPFSYATFKR